VLFPDRTDQPDGSGAPEPKIVRLLPVNDRWTNIWLFSVCTLPSTPGFTNASTRPSTTPRECHVPLNPTGVGVAPRPLLIFRPPVSAVVSRSTVRFAPLATP
jgi:hypothetical protein